MGLPEPPDNTTQENLSTDQNNLMIPSDSDSDGDDSHTGYELLQMGPEIEDNYDTDNDEEDLDFAEGKFLLLINLFLQ